jgi:hypothetical protein
MNYGEAANIFAKARNKREGKPLCNNTRLMHRYIDHGRGPENEAYAVKLHATDVVTLYPDGSFKLDTGRWWTMTTKDRINRYMPMGNIASERGVWYYELGRRYVEDVPQVLDKWGYPKHHTEYQHRSLYYDGMVIGADGIPVAPRYSDEAIITKLDRAIARYKKDFLAEVKATVAATGELPQVSPRDCWGCLMVTEEGENDVITGVEHYFDHFAEGYYPAALFQIAFNDRIKKYRFPGIPYHSMLRDFAAGHDNLEATRALMDYFTKRKPRMVEALRTNPGLLRSAPKRKVRKPKVQPPKHTLDFVKV